MLKSICGACLALVVGAALADGVPLITSGPAISANSPIRNAPETKAVDFVKHHSITLNRAGFGANVLTVMVEGKEHTFVGSMIRLPTRTDLPPGLEQPAFQAWQGVEVATSTQGPGTLTLTRDAKTGAVSGVMRLPPARDLEILPTGFMIERDQTLAPRNIDRVSAAASAPRGAP